MPITYQKKGNPWFELLYAYITGAGGSRRQAETQEAEWEQQQYNRQSDAMAAASAGVGRAAQAGMLANFRADRADQRQESRLAALLGRERVRQGGMLERDMLRDTGYGFGDLARSAAYEYGARGDIAGTLQQRFQRELGSNAPIPYAPRPQLSIQDIRMENQAQLEEAGLTKTYLPHQKASIAQLDGAMDWVEQNVGTTLSDEEAERAMLILAKRRRSIHKRAVAIERRPGVHDLLNDKQLVRLGDLGIPPEIQDGLFYVDPKGKGTMYKFDQPQVDKDAPKPQEGWMTGTQWEPKEYLAAYNDAVKALQKESPTGTVSHAAADARAIQMLEAAHKVAFAPPVSRPRATTDTGVIPDYYMGLPQIPPPLPPGRKHPMPAAPTGVAPTPDTPVGPPAPPAEAVIAQATDNLLVTFGGAEGTVDPAEWSADTKRAAKPGAMKILEAIREQYPDADDAPPEVVDRVRLLKKIVR